MRLQIGPVERAAQRLDGALVSVKGEAGGTVLWHALERTEQNREDPLVPDSQRAQDRFQIDQMIRIRGICICPQHRLQGIGSHGCQGPGRLLP
jgi:hypothetical protein